MQSKNLEKDTLKKKFNLTVPLIDLNNKKILITGCNGFIASSFIAILSELMNEKKYNLTFYGIVRKHSYKINTVLHKLIKTNKLKIFKVDISKEININIGCHWSTISMKGICINLMKTAIPAILGTTAKKLVTELGAPS